MSTATLDTEVLPEIETDLIKPDGKAHRARIKAIISGGPVVALCGKKWVPVIRGAEVLKMPLCQPCESLYELLKSMD